MGDKDKSADVVRTTPDVNLDSFKKDETKSYEKLNLTRGVENIKLIEARQITLQSLSDIELKEVIAVGDVQNNIKKIQQGKLTMQELSDRELLDLSVVAKALGI